MSGEKEAMREIRQAADAIGSASFRIGLHMNDLPCADELEAALELLYEAKEAIVEALDEAEGGEDENIEDEEES